MTASKYISLKTELREKISFFEGIFQLIRSQHKDKLFYEYLKAVFILMYVEKFRVVLCYYRAFALFECIFRHLDFFDGMLEIRLPKNATTIRLQTTTNATSVRLLINFAKIFISSRIKVLS